MPDNLEDLNNSCGFNSSSPTNPPLNPPSQPIVYPPDQTLDNSGNQSSEDNKPVDDAEIPIINIVRQVKSPNYNTRVLDTTFNTFYPYGSNDYRTNFFYESAPYKTFSLTGSFTIDCKLQNTGITEGYFYVTTKAYISTGVIFQDDRLFRVTNNTQKVFGLNYYLPRHDKLTITINDFTNINSATTVFTKGNLGWYGYLKPEEPS
jgi:hypothetical protein